MELVEIFLFGMQHQIVCLMETEHTEITSHQLHLFNGYVQKKVDVFSVALNFDIKFRLNKRNIKIKLKCQMPST